MSTKYSDNNFFFNHTSRIIKEKSFASHSHEAFEVIFFKKGHASYSIDGKEYTLKRHDLIFTRPFDIHAINVETDEEYERYNIIFDENAISSSLLNKIPDSINVISFDSNRNVIELFDKTEYYLSATDNEDAVQIMTGMVNELLLNIIIEAKNERVSINELTNPILYKAIEYIERNLLTLKGIDEIANELYNTKSHLHHLFLKHMNTSPKKYITTKRIALAQREILSGSKPTEVYLRCGFSDYSSFYRAYCRYFGRNPSDKAVANQGAKLKL